MPGSHLSSVGKSLGLFSLLPPLPFFLLLEFIFTDLYTDISIYLLVEIWKVEIQSFFAGWR